MKNLSKSQKRLFVVLAIVIGYGIYDVFSNWEDYSGIYGSKKKTAAKVTEQNVNAVNIVKPVERISYEKDWNKDPFHLFEKKTVVRKKTSAVKRQVYLNLKAISFAGENSVAMINNEILSVGGSISGYRVTKIEPDRVVLKQGGSQRILRLN